ncbi:MAG: DUF1631 domain-containing protein [Burkholderiales bacterium]|nr:DUF1631 domain-containing protein [Burkholderiales bacterium]
MIEPSNTSQASDTPVGSINPAPGAQVLLAAVRDKLAAHFATQMVARSFSVADMLEVQGDHSKDKTGRDALRHAAETLKALGEPLLNGITSSVRRQFDQKLKPDRFNSLGTLTLDTLELVDVAQMEEEIAIGKSSIRLKEQVNFEFFSLSRRIGHLLDLENILDRDNPVFPSIFAHAIMDALRHCGCLPAQRLVIFEAFGPILIETLPATYQLANDYLIEHGVLIEIKESYGRAILGKSAEPQAKTGAAAPSAGGSAPLANAAASTGNEELLALLQQVLQPDDTASSESGGVLQRALAAAGTSMTGEAALGGIGILQGSLRAQLHLALDAQARLFSPVVPAGQEQDGQVAAPILADSLDLTKLVTTSVIVGAFNRLLASPSIREHVGALLLCLQAPTISAALAAPELLVDAAHPVRKALDRLMEFAIAQPTLLHPGTSSYESLALAIHGLAPAYDAGAFVALADRIDTLFAYHEEATAEQDPKATMLIEIELVESAINSANHAIESRLNRHADNPEFICTFVRVVWKEVLFGDMLNGGPAGDLWQRDIATLENLLRTIHPQDTTDERAELLRSLPLLQSRLDEGAQSVQCEPDYLAAFMAQLRAAQADNLSGSLRRTASRERTAAQDSAVSALATTSQLKATGLFLAMPHLVRGHWVEFIDEDTGARRRARLNWMSPIGAVCLFRDYIDNTSFTIELKELSEQLDQKRARLVESLGISRHAIEFAIRNMGLGNQP